MAKSDTSLIKWEDEGHRMATPVGWRVGAVDHPATTQQIVLAAQHVPSGTVYLLTLKRVDVMRPYTDEEVRAMVGHQWGLEEHSPPMGIRLIAAQFLVERYR